LIQHLDSLRGRAFVLILGLLIASNAAALLLYGERHDGAMDALHDVMVAEQAAIVFQFMDRLPAEQRGPVTQALSGGMIRVAIGDPPANGDSRGDDLRAERIGGVINALLGRTKHDRIQVALTPEVAGAPGLSAGTEVKDPAEPNRFAEAILHGASIQGRLDATTALSDGTNLTVTSPLMSVPHFSWPQLLPSLGALTLSALLTAFWFLDRLTAPLRVLQSAAQRLTTDINAPALTESGPFEVRSATAAFNALQSHIKQLIADRTATAAAIAHDLGTPVTRMRLRAFEVEDEDVRGRILSDLDQMQRMIVGALDFTRLDFAVEKTEYVSLNSIAESVASDLFDLGKDISVRSDKPITVATKPVLLRRALMNLAENAAEYGDFAEIHLNRLRDTIEIGIFDGGPGLNETEWQEAMQPFQRLSAGSEHSDGSGMGLTIAKRIVENLGGTLRRTQDSRGRFGVVVSFGQDP